MDKILARDEPDALFSESNREVFSARAWEIIERTRKQVNQAFERLYGNPDGLRVIHNDLWHGNIKVYRGRLHPLDFEDTVWGYPVQDLAMAIQDLIVDVEADEFEGLKGALREGYESWVVWPEAHQGQMDTFRAGRMLWVANYVARFQREHLKEHLEWLARQFERFLESGEIRKF
jgi:Ser/Thr protein kinase RdoA (MazF antagonist)